MRFLIDTHILIWFLEGNKSLSKSRRQTISDQNNDIFVSIASLWEIAIKISIGKVTLAKPFDDVIKQITTENIEILSVSPAHTLQVSKLPFHHRDPFDRILISQSQVENLPVMTDDIEFGKVWNQYFITEIGAIYEGKFHKICFPYFMN